MGAPDRIRPLLAADVALRLGLVKPWDVMAALQARGSKGHESLQEFLADLSRVAQLGPDALAQIQAETQRRVGEEAGDAMRALSRLGGPAASLVPRPEMAASPAEPASSTASRAPLRTIPEGRYRDFEPVGEGGMGIVYWALDTELNRQVAFKIVRPDLNATMGPQTPETPLGATPPRPDSPASHAFHELKTRFLQEAWVTGGLEHPGIVPVYEMGQTAKGIPYYTMRFVRGQRTLATALDEARRVGPQERLRLLEPFLKVCDTIGYAHSRGVIHRDIKPQNIALGEFGEVVVLDWGLAKMRGAPDPAASRWQERIADFRAKATLQTSLGPLGTPGYMSPEAALGKIDEVAEASDIYSLGTILFELLTGRLPFAVSTYGDYLEQISSQQAPVAAEIDPAIPVVLSDLCARALSRNAALRPANAAEVAAVVRQWQAEAAVATEIEEVLTEARAAWRTACATIGEEQVHALDRVSGTCEQVLRRKLDHSEARLLLGKAMELRGKAQDARDRAARRRVLRRTGVLALATAALAATAMAFVVNDQKREAEQATVVAEEALRAKAAESARADQAASDARGAAASADQARSLAEGERVRADEERRNAEAAAHRARELELLAKQEAARATKSADDEKAARKQAEGARTLALRSLADGYGHLALARLREGRIAAAQLAAAQAVLTSPTLDAWKALGLTSTQSAPSIRAFGPGVNGQAFLFNREGSSLVARGSDGRVYAWRLPDGHLSSVFRANLSSSVELGFSEDGRRLLCGSRMLIDTDTGLPVSVEEADSEVPPEAVSSMFGVFCPPYVGVCYMASGGSLRECDIRTRRVLSDLHGPAGEINCVAVAPDAKRLVAGHVKGDPYDREPQIGSLVVWNLQSKQRERIIPVEEKRVVDIAISSDARYAYTLERRGYNDNERVVRIWDLELGQLAGTWEAPAANPSSIRLSPRTAELLVSFDPDIRASARDEQPEIVALSLKDGHVQRTLRAVGPMAVSRDGSLLACNASDGTGMQLMTIQDGGVALVLPSEGHTGGVGGLVLSQDGQLLVSLGQDSVRRWDVSLGGSVRSERLGELSTRATFMRAERQWFVATPDRKTMYVAGIYGSKGIQQWDLGIGRVTGTIPTGEGEITCLDISADGSTLCAGSVQGHIRTWSAREARSADDWDSGRGAVAVIAYGLTPGTLLTAHGHMPSEPWLRAVGPGAVPDVGLLDAHAIVVWDVQARRPLAKWVGHRAAVNRLIVVPSARLVCSGDDEGTIRTWDAATGAKRLTLENPGTRVLDLVASSDGRRLFAAYGRRVYDSTGGGRSASGLLRVWDMESGSSISILEGHAGDVAALALSGNGQHLYSGGYEDDTVLEWSMDRVSRVRSFRGNTGAILDLALTPNGAQLGSVSADWFGSGDSRTLLWDCKSGEIARELPIKGYHLSCSTGIRRLIMGPKMDLYCASWDP